MKLQAILDVVELDAEVQAGFIRAQALDNLTIYNYTDKTQFEKHWNPVTSQCRGIIINHRWEVLARPFPKFFNVGEQEAQIDPDGACVVYDKLDGSLGISYVVDGEARIATRGSLSSEQAGHASAWLQLRHPEWMPPAGVTCLFEIIYPENRIVVDYGEFDGLVLLAGIEISTGNHVDIDQIDWPGSRVNRMPYFSLQEALEAAPRKNVEGMVVHFTDTNTRVKIKQEDYVRLHRIVTGWNERTIWEHLAEGERLDELIAGLPDEFHRWATKIGRALVQQHAELIEEAETAYRSLTEYILPADYTRKDFALEASKHHLRPALFSILDGKDLTAWAWKQIRPSTQKEASLV